MFNWALTVKCAPKNDSNVYTNGTERIMHTDAKLRRQTHGPLLKVKHKTKCTDKNNYT